MAAQRPLEPLILVRVQAPQLTFPVEKTRYYETLLNKKMENYPFSELGLTPMSRSLIFYSDTIIEDYL